jgi:hypothetical protein
MTHRVTVAEGARLEEIYSGPNAKYAELTYQGAIAAVRFAGGTATVESRCERHDIPMWIARTRIEAGRSLGQQVSWPGRTEVERDSDSGIG